MTSSHRSRKVLAAVALLAAVASPELLQAQGAPLAVESRGGVAVPVSSFANGSGVGEGADAGAAFGFQVTLASGGRRTLSAGFSQLRFGCGDAGCPAGERFVATGVNVGLRLALLPQHRVIPWVGVSGLTNRVESPGVTGSAAGVSELGYGMEASAGLFVDAGRSLAFTPSIRVARAGTDLPGGVRLSLRYVVADLGLALTF